MVSAWIALSSGALASLNDSTLLGYVSVISAFACIGFHVQSYGSVCFAMWLALFARESLLLLLQTLTKTHKNPRCVLLLALAGLCLAIGFASDEAMDRCIVSSTILLAFFVAARLLLNAENKVTLPHFRASFNDSVQRLLCSL